MGNCSEVSEAYDTYISEWHIVRGANSETDIALHQRSLSSVCWLDLLGEKGTFFLFIDGGVL